MAGYRKLGRTSAQRKAMLRSLTTDLLYHGRITTTVTRAKEVRRQAEKLITLAVREKDNYETVTVTQKVPKKTADGKRVKEVVDGKKVTVYEEATKTIKKDNPSRLHARRQMMQVFYDVVETPADGVKKRSLTKKVDLVAKMFDEIGPKYDKRNGGYTRIVKVGPRKGDAAEMAIIELVYEIREGVRREGRTPLLYLRETGGRTCAARGKEAAYGMDGRSERCLL